VAVEPVVQAVEAVPEPVVPVAEEKVTAPVEEILPVLASVEAPPTKPLEVPHEAPAEAATKTYSFEEVLSEIEAVTGRLKARYGGGGRSGAQPETKAKKGKKESTVKDEEVVVKPKPKKPGRRQAIREDIEDLGEEGLGEEGLGEEDLGEKDLGEKG
jgi:hypothetical protein